MNTWRALKRLQDCCVETQKASRGQSSSELGDDDDDLETKRCWGNLGVINEVCKLAIWGCVLAFACRFWDVLGNPGSGRFHWGFSRIQFGDVYYSEMIMVIMIIIITANNLMRQWNTSACPILAKEQHIQRHDRCVLNCTLTYARKW